MKRGSSPPLEHARQPVHRGVGVAAAQALDEGGDHVVVRLAALVVVGQARLERGGDVRRARSARPRRAPPPTRAGRARGARRPGRAARSARARRARATCPRSPSPRSRSSSARVTIRPSALSSSAFSVKIARARAQRGDHLERRVLGRRAEQHHRAALDVGQQRVLLRLVEAVDLVDEERGAHAAAALFVGARDLLAQVLHAGQHGRDRREAQARRARPAAARAWSCPSPAAPRRCTRAASPWRRAPGRAARPARAGAPGPRTPRACAAASARRAARRAAVRARGRGFTREKL